MTMRYVHHVPAHDAADRLLSGRRRRNRTPNRAPNREIEQN